MFTTDYKEIKKAVIRSQHCQRNFDLSKTIPDEDLDIMIHAATNCPSKQNISFYRLHVVKDPDMIQKIHALSTGVTADNIVTGECEVATTNSQTLANVLFIFERKELYEMSETALEKWARADESEYEIYKRDLNVAIGIASGYLNFSASLLGYSTGCCQCFQKDEIGKLMGLEKGPDLIMGVGYNDESRNRRIHAADPTLMFPTRKKEEIEVRIV